MGSGGRVGDRLATEAAATEIAAAVSGWLGGLDATQRATATLPFETDERFAWQYTPGPRNGVAIRDLTAEQRAAAFAIVRASLSDRGAHEVAAVMALETVLGELERGVGRPGWQRRDPELYWFAVFGVPSGPGPWSWRVGGHHVAVQLTFAGGMVVGSAPSFLGANPAVVPSGPNAGERALSGEETLARALLAGLDATARRKAVVGATAPADILSGNGRRAEIASIPTGVRYGELDARSRDALGGLVRHYVGRARPDVAKVEWDRIRSAGLDEIAFAWAGPEEPGRGHYYAIRGPAFLIEYDNTQNGANHIHAVWRDLENDWGEDLLAAHYASRHADGARP